MKAVVGELTFSTKAEAEEHFRDMLHRYELYDPVSEADARELAWLLERHPTVAQKRGNGILGFSIELAPGGCRRFQIRRTDGSTTDFSYLKCISAPAIETKLYAALRKEVADDILAAKCRYFEANGDASGCVPCKITGVPVTIDQADADHAPPYTFEVLSRTFLAAHKIAPHEELLIPPADNQLGRLLLDRTLADDWRTFHHKFADLRIVAKSKHRSMSQASRPKAANRQLSLDDPGVISDGIRDRAMRAVLERGHEPEDPEKTRRSQEFWAQFRARRTRP